MAKIVEDVLIIKFSKIIKDNESDPTPALSNDTISSLEQVAQELVGQGVVVEVERA